MTTQQLFVSPELVAGNTKAAMKDIQAVSSDLWKVPLDKFVFIEGFNPRTDTPAYLAHIEEVAQSILANGYYQDKPIAAFVDEDGAIRPTDGHTRIRAARRAVELGAPLETLPTVIKPRGTSMEDITVALVTSNTGKPLTPYETALVVKRLIDMGLDEKTVAKRLNYTTPYVQDLLTLVAAPKPIRDMVANGQVAASVAVKEWNTHGTKAVARLKAGLDKAKAAGKTKMSPKHLDKSATAPLKFHTTIHTIYPNSSRIAVVLDGMPSDLVLGDEVVVTIKRKG